MKQLERLYKTSAKGATQVIDMMIEGDTYTRTWGQLDGKMQSKATTAKSKNIGKSNETTAEEQAVLEAEAVWVKKQKTGYSTSAEAPTTVLLPMKVSVYQAHKKKVTFPVFTSMKLNGVNAEYRLVNGELKLLSRGGEEYTIPEHQRVPVLKLMEHLTVDSLNGEMYKHGEHLQDIMAATKKHNELTPSLSFHVFEFPTVLGTYENKCHELYAARQAYVAHDVSSIPFVPVWVANSHEELDDQHAQCVFAGYEGLIIRNPKAEYKYNTRSLNVFKYKEALEDEFEVSGYNLDKNGHAVFICKVTEAMVASSLVSDSPITLSDSSTFKVKLKGTNEERLAMAAEANNYIGKWLNVEYETLSKDGIPLKPVGQYFRKVDENGEAIE